MRQRRDGYRVCAQPLLHRSCQTTRARFLTRVRTLEVFLNGGFQKLEWQIHTKKEQQSTEQQSTRKCSQNQLPVS